MSDDMHFVGIMGNEESPTSHLKAHLRHNLYSCVIVYTVFPKLILFTSFLISGVLLFVRPLHQLIFIRAEIKNRLKQALNSGLINKRINN